MAALTSFIKSINVWRERYWLTILKVGIVCAILVASFALAPRIALGNRMPRMILLGCAAIGGLVVFIRWPSLSLILTLFGGWFIRYSGPSGLNVTILGLMLLLALWILGIFTNRRKVHFASSKTIKPVLFFILASIISFGFGQIPWYPFARQAALDAQIGGLIIFIISAGAFLLSAHLLRDLRWLKILTWVFIATAGIYIIGYAVHLNSIVDRIYHRGAISESMFWTWLVALAFSQAFFNRRLHPILRITLGCLVIATFYVAYVYNYGWKSGWVPALVCLAAMLGFRYWRSLWFLVFPAIILAQHLATQVISVEDYSAGTRIDAWKIVIEIAKINPILGMGFANYYWYTPLFPIRGWYVSFNSHNQYLDIIAQIGLLGLACLLWFFWEIGKLAYWLRERVPVGFERAYVYGVLGGFVGTLFAGFLVDWFLPFVYNIGLTGFRSSVLPWIFLGGLVSIEQVYRHKIQV